MSESNRALQQYDAACCEGNCPVLSACWVGQSSAHGHNDRILDDRRRCHSTAFKEVRLISLHPSQAKELKPEFINQLS